MKCSLSVSQGSAPWIMSGSCHFSTATLSSTSKNWPPTAECCVFWLDMTNKASGIQTKLGKLLTNSVTQKRTSRPLVPNRNPARRPLSNPQFQLHAIRVPNVLLQNTQLLDLHDDSVCHAVSLYLNFHPRCIVPLIRLKMATVCSTPLVQQQLVLSLLTPFARTSWIT